MLAYMKHYNFEYSLQVPDLQSGLCWPHVEDQAANEIVLGEYTWVESIYTSVHMVTCTYTRAPQFDDKDRRETEGLEPYRER